MIETELWYDIHEVTRDALIGLIEDNQWNQRLKTVHPSDSIIPIFHYWNCVYREERKYIIAVDRFWRNQIMGILTYTESVDQEALTMITVWVAKKWYGIGTQLIDQLLASHRDTITTLIAEIHPDDPSYEARWKNFLERKTHDFGIQLQVLKKQ